MSTSTPAYFSALLTLSIVPSNLEGVKDRVVSALKDAGFEVPDSDVDA